MADILNKVVSGLSQGVATVGANSKAMVEKAKIKTAISNLETERKQIAELLGMKVYDKFSGNPEVLGDSGMSNFIAEIGNRTNAIAENHAELKRIDEELSKVSGAASVAGIACACGFMVAEGAKFCPKCGSAQQPKVAHASGSACACGFVIVDDAKFCPKCGSVQQPKPAMEEEALPVVENACACGFVFVDEGKFCPKCGTSR